jgi:hypothetical protein
MEPHHELKKIRKELLREARKSNLRENIDRFNSLVIFKLWLFFHNKVFKKIYFRNGASQKFIWINLKSSH